jgi:hypothetical protein
MVARNSNGKKCRRCGLWQPHSEYAIKERRSSGSDVTPTVYRSTICNVCEVAARLESKAADPYRHAFRQRRRQHAKRWGYTVEDLVRMGWDEDRRSIEMQAAYEHGYCPLCIEVDASGKPQVHFFRDMTHGLSDLTIDRMRCEEPPIWPGNIQWVDKTCNSRKHRKDPILHGMRLQAEHDLRVQELNGDRLFVPYVEGVQATLF